MTNHTVSIFRGSPPVSTAVACSIAWLLLVGGLGLSLTVQATEEYGCPGNEVCRNTHTFLPLRVLPRPFSTIYTEKAVNSEVVSSNVTAFRPLFVFDRVGVDHSDPSEVKGWYRVGASEKTPIGWIQAKDVLEWKQALIVSYTPQGSGDTARKRVFGFKDEKLLRAVAEGDNPNAEVERRFADLAKKQKPEGVITVEPLGDLDIDEHFYLFPVLEWREATVFDEPYPRYLQLLSAIPKERDISGTKTTLEDKGFAAEVAGDATATAIEHLKGKQTRSIEIVFAMDLTNSMKPFIGLTKSAIHTFRLLVPQKLPANVKVRFGFVGYRDDASQVPGMEFTAKNFTPTLLEADEFNKLLGHRVHVAQATSVDYQEEVFAGLKEAIASAWSDDTALRLILLVGDASSHRPGHPQNTTGLGPEEVRRLADQNNVYLIALHLQDPEDMQDWALATEQFSVLSRNPGDEVPSYLPVEARNNLAYEEAVKIIATRLVDKLGGAGVLPQLQSQLAAQMPKTDTGRAAMAIADRIAQNAMVDYLGDGQKAQTDVTFWAFDRDLTDPETPALRVHVLLSRAQIENLIRALEAVIKAVKTGRSTHSKFMHSLQAVLAQGSYGEEIDAETADRLFGVSVTQWNYYNNIKIDPETADSLADTRLLPRWIEGLPYRSQVLGLSDTVIESMNAEDQAQFEQNLDAKLALYRELMETDRWIELHEGDAKIDQVHPLPLENLP